MAIFLDLFPAFDSAAHTFDTAEVRGQTSALTQSTVSGGGVASVGGSVNHRPLASAVTSNDYVESTAGAGPLRPGR